MAKKRRDDQNNLEYKLYSLEKETQKAIAPHQKAIEKLHKENETINDTVHKDFSASEKKFILERASINRRYDELKTKQEIPLNKAIESLNDKLQIKLKKQKETREAVKLDQQKSLLLLKDKRDAFLEEKALILKEIEKKNIANIQTYQDKLNLYTKNYKKNTNKAKALYKEALETLIKTKEESPNTLSTLLETMQADFSRYKETCNDSFKQTLDSLKASETSFQTHVNNHRKNINATLKSITSNLYQATETIKAPFTALSSVFDTLNNHTIDYASRLKEAINKDKETETLRLQNTLNALDTTPTKKEQKDFDARQRLIDQRADTLLKSTDTLTALMENVTVHFKDVISDTHTHLLTAFKQQEALLDHHQATIKEGLDIFQQPTSAIHQNLIEVLKNENPEVFLKDYQELYTSILKTLHAHHVKTLDLMIESMHNLDPIHQELDAIRFDLDTVDPNREIAINKEKTRIEQNDAAIRQDMHLEKLNNELKTQELDHKKKRDMQDLTHQLEAAQFEQQQKDAIEKQTLTLARTDIERDEALATVTFNERQAYTNTDMKRLEQLHKVERKISEEKYAIKRLEINKNFAIKALEDNAQTTYKIETTTLELERTKQYITRLKNQQHEKESALKSVFERDLSKLHYTFEKDLNQLDHTIQKEKENYEKTLSFIDTALKRETKKAKENIKSIDTMIESRLEYLNVHYLDALRYIKSKHALLRDTDSSRKQRLSVVAKPFITSLERAYAHYFKTLSESEQFIHSIHLKGIETDDENKDRKKQILTQKENDTFSKKQKQLESEQKQALNQLNLIVLDAREAIKKHASITEQSLYKILNDAFHALKKHHQDTIETLISKLHLAFKPLKLSDQRIIDKATTSSVSAKEEALERYKKALKPLEIKREGLKETFEENKNQLQSAFEDTKNEALSSLYKSLDESTAKKDAQSEDLQALKDTQNTLSQSIEEEKKVALARAYEKHEESLEAINTRTREHTHKLMQRLDEAKALFEQEKSMEETTLETLQNTYNTKTDQHAFDVEKVKELVKRKQEDLENTHTQAIKDLAHQLDEAIEGFETRILSSASQLEARIEDVNRKTEETLRLKEARKHELETQIKRIDINIKNRMQTHFEDTNNTLLSLHQSLDETLASTLTSAQEKALKDIVDKQKSIVEDFIESTLSAIKNA